MNENEAPKNAPEKPRKGPRKRTLLLGGLALLLLLLMGAFAWGAHLLDSMEREEILTDDANLGIGKADVPFEDYEPLPPEEDETPESPKEDPEPTEDPLPYYHEGVTGITHIALFGIDAEAGTAGRSDAIMILTVDQNSKKIKLSSLPRDAYVRIPGRGMDKLGHAYAYGGAQLALQTLNANFHLDLRDFAAVNFTSLPRIIDTLGGVRLRITDAEATQIPGISRGGTYTLNGAQALAFSRIRKIDSDFERSRRQRDVMESVIQKMLGQPVTSYPRTLSSILPLIRTNMGSSEILSLAGTVVTRNIRTIEQRRFPLSRHGQGRMIQGTYYFVFDRSATIHALGRYLYLDEE